jgi:hypothetical protein
MVSLALSPRTRRSLAHVAEFARGLGHQFVNWTNPSRREIGRIVLWQARRVRHLGERPMSNAETYPFSLFDCKDHCAGHGSFSKMIGVIQFLDNM